MKKINKFALPIVTISVFFSSCSQPDPSNLALTKILEDISKVDKLPTINKGVISGSILNNFNGENPEITVKIIRNEDIFELDKDGKPKKGADGKEITKEKKGQVLQTIKLKDKYSFFTDSLLPGSISIQSSKKPENLETTAIVDLGKVTLIQPIVFGLLDQGGGFKPPSVINISGKIVNPDGSPVAGAKVADVTGGFVNISTITDSNGAFTLSEAPFTKPRSIEVSMGNVDTPEGKFASYSVLPDVTENIVIPLVSNARFISGRVFNSVLKTTSIEGLNIKIDGTNISTNTDKEGKFRLKGVSLGQVNLTIGGIKGYIDRIITVSSSQVNEDRNLGDLFIVPLGGVRVNLAAESSPLFRQLDNGRLISSAFIGNVTTKPVALTSVTRREYIRPHDASIVNPNHPVEVITTATSATTYPNSIPVAPSTSSGFTNATLICGAVGKLDGASSLDDPNDSLFRRFDSYVQLNSSGILPNCEYINGLVYKKAIQGVIQFEGTDIKKSFTYPATPQREITIFSAFDKKTLSVDAPNERISIPIEDVPGGEYTVSISLDHHETQKGLRLLIPSNDITSTELIQMRVAKAITSLGDITGKIIIKDLAGNIQPVPAGTKVAVISSFDQVIAKDKLEEIFNDALTGSGKADQQSYAKSDVNSDGTYTLRNVPSGTRIVVAAVFSGTTPQLVVDESLIPNTYVLVNVVSGLSTKASDIVMTKR